MMWKRFAVPLLLVTLFCFSIPVRAEQVQVDAYIDQTTAQLGDQLTLTVKISGDANPRKPRIEIPGCIVAYYGASSQYTLINGAQSMEVNFSYAVVPNRAGNIEVPPIEVKVRNRVYRTQPIQLTIIDPNQNGGYGQGNGYQSQQSAQTQNAQPNQQGNQQSNQQANQQSNQQANQSRGSQGSSGTNSASSSGNTAQSQTPPQGSNGLELRREGTSGKVFLVVKPAKTRMYVQETVPITVALVFRTDQKLRNIHYPEMKLQNFLQGEFTEPDQETQEINGEEYVVIPFKTTVRPITPGKYQIGSVTLAADLMTEIEDSLSAFDSFFGSDYKLTPLKLTAKPVKIEVLDVPKAGKPADYKGAVGNFRMDVQVTPDEVHVGEPLTIRTKITGTGSFDTVTAPVLDKNQNYKYYDPQEVKPNTNANTNTQANANANTSAQIRSTQYEKTFEQVIIPTAEVKSLPKIHFSYFDPTDEEFHTLNNDSVNVKVSSGQGGKSGQVLDYRNGNGANSEQTLGEDIVYIKATPGKFHGTNSHPLLSPGLIGYNAALLLTLAGGILYRRQKNQETPEELRRKEVTRQTAELLNRSANLLQDGQVREFYDTIYPAVQNFLKEYFQIAITGISDYEAEHLEKAGLSSELLTDIKDFYRRIDERRFAGASGSVTDMEQILALARNIVARVEKGEVV